MKFIVKYKVGLILCAMILSYSIMGVFSILRMSLTFDELAHLPGGYTYIAENDYRINSQDHPPLAKIISALPLGLLKLNTFTYHSFWKKGSQWLYGDLFMYNNKIKHYTILNTGRIMLLTVSILLGILVFMWGRELGGDYAGLIGAGLCYFFPGFIANGGIVATDVPATICYFFSVYCLWKLFEKYSIKRVILFGISIGLTLSVKFSGILLFPSLCFLLCWMFYRNKKVKWRKVFATFFVISAAVIFVIAIVYRFKHVGWYVTGFKNIFQHVKGGRGSFLLGKNSTTGWWYYFPVGFLLKTPSGVLFLILMCLGMIPYISRLEKGIDKLMFLVIPPFIYFASAVRSPMQIGYRHILPIYPFIFTWIGWSCVYFKNWKKYIAGAALAAIFMGVLYSQPFSKKLPPTRLIPFL